jgi:2-polyprenyl-3-methyl-5-hydroxy-6-metoxy-1,4-benzoquinol methylase
MSKLSYPIGPAHLDAFVAEYQARGPGDPATAISFADEGFCYKSDVRVDITLDPFSEDYVGQQLALHGEISGASDYHPDLEVHEFGIDELIKGANPYPSVSDTSVPLHIHRLSKAVRLANLPAGSHVLDFGAGHGLSSELCAYFGHRVTAVDINPNYVRLINERAKRRGLDITAVCAQFDAFSSSERFDAVIFYESLHHAVRPWMTLNHVKNLLTPRGVIILVGEPINEIWWPNWGLRLDPVSIRAMRHHGWFESGWSWSFVQEMFRRIGMGAALIADSDHLVGPIVHARLFEYCEAPAVADVPLPVVRTRRPLPTRLANSIAKRLKKFRGRR